MGMSANRDLYGTLCESVAWIVALVPLAPCSGAHHVG